MSKPSSPLSPLLTRVKALAGLARWLDQRTPLQLASALTPLSVLMMTVSTCAVLSSAGDLPPPDELPEFDTRSPQIPVEHTKSFFRARVEGDAEKLGVPLSLEELREGLPYRIEFDGRQTLRAKRSLQTKSLTLSAGIKNLWIGEAGRGIRTRHLVLAITNKTDRPLAYRVRTETDHPCRVSAALAHNALALQPNETAERTECLLRQSKSLRVVRVEVLELTGLGHAYVSRIDPVPLAFDPHAYAGHTPGPLGPCTLLPWREIRSALARHEAEWRDVIDFYARHDCDAYIFPAGYRWQPEGPSKLPALPPPTQR